jgi:hypothetical protein
MITAWSHPTWKLFHILTAKLNEKSFDKKFKNKCIKLFTNICNAIPCIHCRDHASEYMKTLNKDDIKTARDLELFFWMFHNEVNERINKTPFPKKKLKMYKKKSVKKITREFRIVLQLYYQNLFLSNEFNALMKKNQDKFLHCNKVKEVKKDDKVKVKKDDKVKVKKDDKVKVKKDDKVKVKKIKTREKDRKY